MPQDYDVAIVGGGLVGASLALALASDVSMRVALVEAYPMNSAEGEPAYQPSYDARSTALAWGTRLIYEDLQLWDQLQQHVTPIRRIHVSDKGQFGATRLHSKDYRQEALGYVVENQWIGQCLLAKIADCSNIDLICPDTVNDIYATSTGAKLTLEKFGEMHASVVVLADGGRSGLREKLAIEVSERDYEQTAIIANLSVSRHHDWTAYERFTPSGPMALLPMGEMRQSDARMALVWTLPKEEADKVMQMSDDRFLEKIQQAFGYRLGKFTQTGSRSSYPLVLSLSKEQVRPALVVVGNAAHTLHPVAGQGYNLALRGVMRLASALIDARREGKSLAGYDVLSRFLPEQDSDKSITVNFSDLLTHLFSTGNPYVSAFLGLGLAGLDLMPVVKGRLSEQAMGLAQSRAVL